LESSEQAIVISIFDLRNADHPQDSFKIQAHAMFLDTAHNSLSTVQSNIYTAFLETATKMWTYARCLPLGKQPGTKLLIKTIEDTIDLAFVLMKSKGKNRRNVGYRCVVSKVQADWLVMTPIFFLVGLLGEIWICGL
jgi:hypothetical protein